MTTEKPDAVHMIHIAAPAQKIWDLLTNAEASPSYFFGNRSEFGPVGGRFQITKPDGTLDTEGVVLVRDEPHLLRVTWQVVWLEEFRNLPPVEVEYRIEDTGNGVCILTASEFKRATDKYVDQARQGWSLILSGIKTLVETGRPMPAITPKAP